MSLAEKRIRMIVADDEEPLRAKLRMFDWESLGVVLEGEAEDGEEALDLCFKLYPDVALVDITMPIMNGMELLAVLKEKLPHIQVILLTCHDQFEYAQTAVKLGATDYLLKAALKPQELERSLQKARSAIANHATLQEHLDNELRQRQAKQFRHLLACEDEEMEQALSELLCGAAGRLRFPVRYARLTLYGSREDEIFIDYEIQKELSSLRRQEPDWLWFPLHTGDYLIYVHEADPLALKRRLEEGIRACREAVQRQLPFIGNDFYLFAAITDPIANGSQFREAFRDSFQWIHYLFYFRDRSIAVGRPPVFSRASRETEEKLRDIAREKSGSIEEMLRFIREDFVSWSREQLLYPEDLKLVTAAFLLDWFFLQGHPHEDFESALHAACRNAGTLEELALSIAHVLGEQPQTGMRKEIAAAKQMIARNLDKPVTLSQIAEEVGLSPDYLGKLFHEQIGENFKQYLTRARMQKAMELLRTTNLKVYTVAEQVGIPNYSYFSVLFRKWAGISPTQMKRGGIG
ncbi:response regulator [Paenibacillaceae bacterium WGS1546]|uniref:response regulator n=1 Tax=Cohnella sp. WGS1546 TaxID=3366810 RepID=UPI00372D6B9B